MAYNEGGPNVITTGGSWDDPKREWVVVLNQYQRDNLLSLMNVVGYGGFDNKAKHGHAGPVEPFHLMNSGDWVGEVTQMLGDPKGMAGQREDAEKTGKHVNQTRANLKQRVAEWVAQVVADE